MTDVEMEDNEPAIQNNDEGAGGGGDDAPVEPNPLVEEKVVDMEVEDEVELTNGEKGPEIDSVTEHLPIVDGPVESVERNIPFSTDAEKLEVILEDEIERCKEDLSEEVLSSSENIAVESRKGIEIEEQVLDVAAENGVLAYPKAQPPILREELRRPEMNGVHESDAVDDRFKNWLLDPAEGTANEAGTEEDQAAFMRELEIFHREKFLDFKPPKFYQEPLNLLLLWRAVVRHGGYEHVTSLKLWRSVGESFKPPKTCTTVSWTFRGFYEKVLLEYERYKMQCGELPFFDVSLPNSGSAHQADRAAPGRARRDAAARAMQGWHSHRLGNGEVADPIIKDKNQLTSSKREKQLKNIGFLKRKESSPVENTVRVAYASSRPHTDTMVFDIGLPADWVKVNVHKTKDCYEVYALIPGLLREEVKIQSDPIGRLIISGQPEHLDNPWGVSPFKKVVNLPSRIDPHSTSAVVTLHGQLFIRVPYEQADV